MRGKIAGILTLLALSASVRADPPILVAADPPPCPRLVAMDEFYLTQAQFQPSALQSPPPSSANAPPAEVEVFQDIGPRWKILAGAGFSVVAPYLNNNRAYTITLPTANGGQTTQSKDFAHPFEVAPRFWLGVAAGNGWGFRTSFWHFDQSEHQSAALDGASPAGSAVLSASPLGLGVATGTALLAPGNADVLSVRNHLNLSLLDFEITKEIEAGPAFLVLSAGGRCARLGQGYSAEVSNTANNFATNAELDRLRSNQNFEGGGPTLALQGWYPLGQTRFSIYGTARGTVLVGAAQQSARTSQLVAGGGGLAEFPLSDASVCRSAVVPVGELELGVQWTGTWRRFQPFVRTGVQAQTWFNALTSSSVPTANGDTANISSNLSFFGVAFQAGLNY